MVNLSLQFSVSSNGYFIVPSADGENIALRYSLIYMIALLPAGVMSGMSALYPTTQIYIYQQVAYLFSTIGITAYFPVYIISHRLRSRACYLLLTGRYKDIKYNV